MSAGPCSLCTFWEGLLFASSYLPVVASSPSWSSVCRCVTPTSASVVIRHSSCVSVSSFLFIRTRVIGFEVHPTPIRPHLRESHPQRPYSKSPTYEPSSCELSKMRTCVPLMSGVSEIAACLPSPIADDPSALPSPTSSPSTSQ